MSSQVQNKRGESGDEIGFACDYLARGAPSKTLSTLATKKLIKFSSSPFAQIQRCYAKETTQTYE